MKIIVFGATGGVGQHAVRRAAEAGHQVTAFHVGVAQQPERYSNTSVGLSL